MSKLTALGHLGLAYETTFGTAVAPMFWLPYQTVKADDVIKQVTDDGRKGNLTKDYAIYNTTQEGTVEVDCFGYPDAIGYFLKAMFGQDTVTGTGPYAHKFQLVNQLGPTMTLSNYNALDERQYAGAAVNELGFKCDTTDKQLDMSAKFNTFLGVVGTTSTPTFTSLAPFLGTELTATLNSVANTNLIGADLTIKREAAMRFTATGTANPSKYTSARVELTGKMTFDIEDASEYSLYTAGTSIPLDFKFTQGTTILEISMGTVRLTKANFDESQEYLRVDAEFRALYNATDLGPATITLTNGVATY